MVKMFPITQMGPPFMKHSPYSLKIRKLLPRQTKTLLKNPVLEVSSPLIKCFPDYNDYLSRGTEEVIHTGYGI